MKKPDILANYQQFKSSSVWWSGLVTRNTEMSQAEQETKFALQVYSTFPRTDVTRVFQKQMNP